MKAFNSVTGRLNRLLGLENVANFDNHKGAIVKQAKRVALRHCESLFCLIYHRHPKGHREDIDPPANSHLQRVRAPQHRSKPIPADSTFHRLPNTETVRIRIRINRFHLP